MQFCRQRLCRVHLGIQDETQNTQVSESFVEVEKKKRKNKTKQNKTLNRLLGSLTLSLLTRLFTQQAWKVPALFTKNSSYYELRCFLSAL